MDRQGYMYRHEDIPKENHKKTRMVSVFCCIGCHSSTKTLRKMPGSKKTRICNDCYTRLLRSGKLPLHGGEAMLIIKDNKLEVIPIVQPKNENTCVSCGQTIPEGRQVCSACNVVEEK